MDIFFASEALRKACNKRRFGIKRWGSRRAEIVGRRLDELKAADTLEDMRNLPGKCHGLKDARWGDFSLKLDGGYRLIFVPAHDPLPTRFDGGIDWSRITAVKIVKVEDYHD